MRCSQCGGNIVDIKPCKIPLEPYLFDDDEEEFQDGFEGHCEHCDYEEVWVDI